MTASFGGLSAEEMAAVKKRIEERPLNEVKKDSLVHVNPDGTPFVGASTWADCALSEALMKGIGNFPTYTKPTVIQELAIPVFNAGKNLVAQSQAGSGKTTAFALGMLSKCDPKLAYPQAVCVVPTQDLVPQHAEFFRKMAEHTGLTLLEGRAGVKVASAPTEQVVVGTHGKIESWLKAKNKRKPALINGQLIKILVVDEADKLMGGGDKGVLMAIREALSPKCQLAFFSATYQAGGKTDADFNQFMDVRGGNGVPHKIMQKNAGASVLANVKQEFIDCRLIEGANPNMPEPMQDAVKLHVIQKIFQVVAMDGLTMIFVNRKTGVDTLERELSKVFPLVFHMYGGMDPAERDDKLKKFRSHPDGAIMIATDVLARGIDISECKTIIHYHLPGTGNRPSADDAATYLQRVGRAGRFGRTGRSIALLTNPGDDVARDGLMRYYGRDEEGNPLELMTQTSLQQMEKEAADAAGEED